MFFISVLFRSGFAATGGLLLLAALCSAALAANSDTVAVPRENAPCLVEVDKLPPATPGIEARTLDCMYRTLIEDDRRLRLLEKRLDELPAQGRPQPPARTEQP